MEGKCPLVGLGGLPVGFVQKTAGGFYINLQAMIYNLQSHTDMPYDAALYLSVEKRARV